MYKTKPLGSIVDDKACLSNALALQIHKNFRPTAMFVSHSLSTTWLCRYVTSLCSHFGRPGYAIAYTSSRVQRGTEKD